MNNRYMEPTLHVGEIDDIRQCAHVFLVRDDCHVFTRFVVELPLRAYEAIRDIDIGEILRRICKDVIGEVRGIIRRSFGERNSAFLIFVTKFNPMH